MKWSFVNTWNESLEKGRPERVLQKREHIWAGEMGSSMIDRFLKMSATPYSNPPNARSLRKFEAGNLMEWIIGLVLKRAGILIPLPPLTNGKPSNWLSYQYPGLLEVTGKLDFLMGGKPDWKKVNEEIRLLDLPEFFNRATKAIVDNFSEKYPSGLEETVLEVKSCSSYMFNIYEATGKPNSNHTLQLFHYLKARDMKAGRLIYACKDDLRMLEFGVLNPSPVEDLYKADIEKMTHFIKNGERPDKEPEIIFDTETWKFRTNWKIEYSNYLKMLYGYSEPEDYRKAWGGKAASFNRTFGRCVNGDKMTKLNLETIKEIKTYFPDFEKSVGEAKKNHVKVEEKDMEGNI